MARCPDLAPRDAPRRRPAHRAVRRRGSYARPREFAGRLIGGWPGGPRLGRAAAPCVVFYRLI